jgi:hypothetical protein
MDGQEEDKQNPYNQEGHDESSYAGYDEEDAEMELDEDDDNDDAYYEHRNAPESSVPASGSIKISIPFFNSAPSQ